MTSNEWEMTFKHPPKPPDDIGRSQNSGITNNKCEPKFNTPGPKYLIMERINSENTLEKISPFLIQKVIDGTINGKLEMCKKIRNGKVLIKTKNINQAIKLLKLKSLSPDIQVKIEEHEKLNISKGVIYSTDLIYLTDKEIIDELKAQYITEIRRIKKVKDNIAKDTGLFILTFKLSKIPQYINVGYERISVRHYIPPPLRCRNCFHFEHHESECKKPKMCINCNQQYHLDDKIEQQKCEKETQCTNCRSTTHTAISKICPVYQKQKEIMKIKVIENTDIKTAKKIYKERYPLETQKPLTAILKQEASTQTIQDKKTDEDKDDTTTITMNTKQIGEIVKCNESDSELQTPKKKRGRPRKTSVSPLSKEIKLAPKNQNE